MERQASLHPADETLVSYGLGNLADTVAESVNKHLEQCLPCRRRVAELSADSFVGRLRESQRPAGDAPPRPKTIVEQEPPRPSAAAGKPPSTATARVAIENLPPELVNHPQYDVLRELGRGGMGVVYLARNKLMDRLEVLKVLNKEMLAKPGTAERFLREIQSAAKLHHANVVAAYTAIQMGDLLVFAMEFVDGEDLAKLVRTRGPLPVVNACYFAYQAAQGLQHAHERGMIHRDIKPGNLILLREGKKAIVKILDFGLAKVTSETGLDRTLTQQGQMLGTPDYIAPEQTLDAQKADIRADIYSLGCTLYHLLTGNTPFAGNSLFEVLQAHHSVDAKPLNLVRPEVPVELAAVVTKMMAKDPNRRYQTPAEVVQALKPFLKPGGLTSSQPELSQVGSRVNRPAAAAGSAPGTEDSSPNLAPMDAVQPEQRWKSLNTPQLDRSSTAKSGIRKGARRQTPWMWPAVAVGAVLFGLVTAWASGVFSVKTDDGVIVLQDLPEEAEVLVDGAKVTVQLPDGDGPAEITVRPGKRGVQVKKDGFQAFGQEVSLASGERKLLAVRLEPLPQKISTRRPDQVATTDPPTRGVARSRPRRWNPPPRRARTTSAPMRPTQPEGAIAPSLSTELSTRTPLAAQPNAPPSADASGWKRLFNGQDLSGWTDEGGGDNCRAVWGQIVARPSHTNAPSSLLTFDDYSNFLLRFEFIPENDSWGAIALRALPGEKLDIANPANQAMPDFGRRRAARGGPANDVNRATPAFGRRRGFPNEQRDTANTSHPMLLLGTPGRVESGTTCWLRGETESGPDHPPEMRPAGLWNQIEIEVNGHSIRSSLNGKEIVRATLNEDVRLSGGAVPGLNRIKGRVGLGCAKGSIRFREIKIKELPATLPVASHPIASNPVASSAVTPNPVAPNSVQPPAPTDVERRIKAAKEEFDAAITSANGRLQSQFDVQIRIQRGKKSSPKALSLAEVLQQEQAAWSENGLVPWSAPMRPSLKIYLQSMQKAHRDLERAFVLASEQAVAAHDDQAAALLQTEKTTVAAPRAVATWRCEGVHAGTIKLYCDGHLDSGQNSNRSLDLGPISNRRLNSGQKSDRHSNQPQNPGTWSFKGDLLVLKIVHPKSPTGFYDEHCKLAPDGKRYLAENQFHQTYTATRVGE
jgi:serine/threonine protein kinase